MSVVFAKNATPEEKSTATIQKLLDENSQLIQTALDYQKSGRIAEAVQYQQLLQRNLIYLAALADEATGDNLTAEIEQETPIVPPPAPEKPAPPVENGYSNGTNGDYQQPSMSTSSHQGVPPPPQGYVYQQQQVVVVSQQEQMPQQHYSGAPPQPPYSQAPPPGHSQAPPYQYNYNMPPGSQPHMGPPPGAYAAYQRMPQQPQMGYAPPVSGQHYAIPPGGMRYSIPPQQGGPQAGENGPSQPPPSYAAHPDQTAEATPPHTSH